MKQILNKKITPILTAVITLTIMVALIYQITEFYQENTERELRNDLEDHLISQKSLLEKSIHSRVYYTKGISAYTSINPDIKAETFNLLAQKLIQKDSVISTMSLAKNGVINAIYPLAGHESALGLNLLEHPARRKIVENTIHTRKTFIAGPVELVEGGIAFISYTPIFSGKNPDKFWGMTDIVIYKDKLFNEINFKEEDNHNKYALRGKDGTGEKGEVFFGDPNIFNLNPVTIDVILPTGSWQLAAVPKEGWQSLIEKEKALTFFLYLASVIISVLVWFLSKAIIKIRLNEKELEALFKAMDNIVIEFDNKGNYKNIAPTNEESLILPIKLLKGKNLTEVFDKEKADFFLSAIQKCLSTKELVIIDYPIVVNNLERWFQARITYVSDKSVLFVGYDNTEKMRAQNELKSLNATKDKLMSIIAHDLRAPFNSTMGLVEIIQEDKDSLSEEEISDYLREIYSSLNNQYKLLENLLTWAEMQKGGIIPNKNNFNFFELVNELTNVFKRISENKKIKINNKVDNGFQLITDRNILRTIIHNLISNSIKFTNVGGDINIFAHTINEKIIIIVEDNGIGISKKKIDEILNRNENLSTNGTGGEKGTGLGLTIVFEMLEKIGGSLQIESSENVGSKFIINLPNSTD